MSEPSNLMYTVTAIPPAQGRSVSMVGDTYRIIVEGKQTSGAFAVIDMLIPPGGGPGPHSHAAIEESFYVVDGEVVFTTKGLSYTARAGAYVYIPVGGAVHCFKNQSRAVAHLLCMVRPAGLESLFREVGMPVAPGQFLPPPQLDPKALQAMTAIAKKYGQTLYPPDYFEQTSEPLSPVVRQ